MDSNMIKSTQSLTLNKSEEEMENGACDYSVSLVHEI